MNVKRMQIYTSMSLVRSNRQRYFVIIIKLSQYFLFFAAEKEEIYQQRLNDEMNKLFTEYQQYMCYIEPITVCIFQQFH